MTLPGIVEALLAENSIMLPDGILAILSGPLLLKPDG